MLEENGTEDLLSRRPFVEDRTNERTGTFFSKVGVGGRRGSGDGEERGEHRGRQLSSRACL